MADPLHFSLIVAVNDDNVLHETLLKSPMVDSTCQVIPKKGYSSAAAAYNAGLLEANHDLLIFAHQDIYFPHGWLASLKDALRLLSSTDPNWGVLGVYGVSRNGSNAGYAYSTGLGRTLGRPFSRPIEAISLDEIVLIMRRSADLRFDTNLPGFHLYGTDICLQAAARGLKNYIISAYCLHNSSGRHWIPASFWHGYLYMRKKWWQHLPVKTPCTVITRTCRPVFQELYGSLKKVVRRTPVGSRHHNPEILYERMASRDHAM